MRKEVVLGRSLHGYNVSLFDRTEAPEFLFFFLIALDWVYGGIDLEVIGRKSMGNEMELGSVGQLEP